MFTLPYTLSKLLGRINALNQVCLCLNTTNSGPTWSLTWPQQWFLGIILRLRQQSKSSTRGFRIRTESSLTMEGRSVNLAPINFFTRTYHITRFISLAAAFNAQKKQFMFGIAIAPLSTMDLQELHEIPPDATAFPFKDHIIQDSAAKRQKVRSVLALKLTLKLDEQKRDLERYAASILDGENARPAYAQRKTNQNRNNPLVSGTALLFGS